MIQLNGHEKPVNKMAAFSYAKGSEYKQKTGDKCKIYSLCPNTIEFSGPKELDLTGTKHTRIKVVGYYGSGGQRKGSLWVIRCVCGNYEIRSGFRLRKAIAGKLNNKIIRCLECVNFANSKRHYEYEKTGLNKHGNLDNY